MEAHCRLLLNNQAWAQAKIGAQSDYFKRLAVDQQPEFLWIGCSDSRVPAEEVTGTSPGEIFVHRNIANLVIHTDFNVLSVVQYAVDFLKVKHVIICGHYGCGGVRAACTHQNFGLLDSWLRYLKDLYLANQPELEAITDGEARTNRLVELNVNQQIMNLAKTSFIQKAWAKEQRPILHGWVFGLDTGILNPVTELRPGSEIPDIYRFQLS